MIRPAARSRLVLPSEAVEEVAEYTHSTTNDIWAVASFYTNFRFTPPGEHTVEVCWGPSCHLRGGKTLAKHALVAAEERNAPSVTSSFGYSSTPSLSASSTCSPNELCGSKSDITSFSISKLSAKPLISWDAGFRYIR